MKFTYDEYEKLVLLLREEQYVFCDYHSFDGLSKCVIMRHDVDMDLEKAVQLARLERTLGVKATYYVLISSDFYNIYSKRNIEMIKEIQSLGHTIGLHYDEQRYSENEVLNSIEKEIDILEKCIETKVTSVSMHRPSKETLESNYVIRGGIVVNSYSKLFFEKFKYLSDSRRNWRENVRDVIKSGQFNRLHILIHPIWYNEVEREAKDVLRDLCTNCVDLYYLSLSNNIRDLEELSPKIELYSKGV